MSIREVPGHERLGIPVRAIGRMTPFILALNTALPAQSSTVLRTEPTCTTCSITIENIAVASLPADSLAFGFGTSFARMSTGYLAWYPYDDASVYLFDSQARFVRAIPRGPGPGEIDRVRNVHVGAGDTLWLVDGRRMHVFTGAGVFVRREVLPSQPYLVLARPQGGMVMAARTGTPESFGYPLHIVGNSGEIAKSFGVVDPLVDPRVLERTNDDVLSYFRRLMLPTAAGSEFWTWNPTRFLLERYDFNGNLLAKVVHAKTGWYMEASSGRQPSPGPDPALALHGVQTSKDPNILWLFYMVYNDNYRPGELLAHGVEGMLTMVDTFVEAVDTRSLTVIAVRRFPNASARTVFSAPDELSLFEPIDEARHTFRIVRLHLAR